MTLPKKVGSKKPNALKIYDMSGNVWEWCESPTESTRPDYNQLKESPKPIKGGSFNRGQLFMEITYTAQIRARYYGGPKSGSGLHTNDLGFRILRIKK